MQRVMIIGSCGAGKSTLARRLYELTKLPLIHLDQHYHLPGWEEPEKDVWEQKVRELIKNDQWIMDGNYGGTMEMRMQRADTVIYLDYPSLICLWRVIRRTWKYYGKVRPDVTEGCKERFDLEFLHYVATYNWVKRPPLLKRLSQFNGEKVILKSDSEIKNYLKRLTM